MNYDISIHAPSRERQDTYCVIQQTFYISIHAPSRERPDDMGAFSRRAYFNPRSLAGATGIDVALDNQHH